MRRKGVLGRPRGRRPSSPTVLTAVLAGLLVLPLPALAQDDPGELLEDGRRAFQRQNYEGAREKLWAYLDATSNLTGAARMPQAEALYYIALMEPDAAVAGRHYQIIVDEFPASPIADGALHRLAVLNLVEGKPDLAIQQFEQLRQNYPVSRYQPEIALWIGQARLAAGESAAAIETFQEGYTRVKSGDLPREIPMGQRDALAAEYAHWLARSHEESGDEQTAMQYYAILTLDYPDSPQAADARQVLASRGGVTPPPAMASAAGERQPGETEGEAPAGEGGEPPAAAVDVPAVAAELPAAAAAEAPPPRDQEVEDIAVADPVAAAPEGVGRGGERPPAAADPVPDVAEVRPEEAAHEDVVVQPERAEPVRGETPRAAPPADVPPAGEDREPPAKFGPGGGSSGIVYLQVGAFTSATRAADLSKRLKADGFNSTVQIAVVEGRGFYRVRVGPFRVSADAQRIDRDRRRLTGLGYPVEQVPGGP